MRVIAGKYRGRALRTPRGRDVRPTADRVKEALFSILQPRVPGARVLDLFAGSGALGIEALSRGATHALFVEIARGSLDALSGNLRTLGVGEEAAAVLRGDVFREAARLGEDGDRFDLIFADPPYLSELAGRTLEAVARARILASGGLLVLEHHRKESPRGADGLRAMDPRRYGDTVLSLYESAEGGST